MENIIFRWGDEREKKGFYLGKKLRRCDSSRDLPFHAFPLAGQQVSRPIQTRMVDISIDI